MERNTSSIKEGVFFWRKGKKIVKLFMQISKDIPLFPIIFG